MATNSSATSRATLKRTVDEAVRKSLGTLPRNAKAYREALTRNFQEGSMTTGEQGMTISQARLYAFATIARDNILPRLERIYPLRPNADPQEIDATRALVRANVTNLVQELGREGGPIAARVQEYFEALLGDLIFELKEATLAVRQNPGKPANLLQQLDDAFFGDDPDINTVEELQDYTDSRVIYDFTVLLRMRWLWYLGDKRADLSETLYRLRAELNAIKDSVTDLREALDDAGFDENEQDGVDLEQDLSIAAWLDWVDDFAANEAPAQIADGGRRGVETIAGTLEELARLADVFVQLGEENNAKKDPRIVDLLKDTAVKRELLNLRGHLVKADELTEG